MLATLSADTHTNVRTRFKITIPIKSRLPKNLIDSWEACFLTNGVAADSTVAISKPARPMSPRVSLPLTEHDNRHLAERQRYRHSWYFLKISSTTKISGANTNFTPATAN